VDVVNTTNLLHVLASDAIIWWFSYYIHLRVQWNASPFKWTEYVNKSWRGKVL